MSEAIAADLKSLETEGAEAYVHLQQMVIILSPLMCLVADNPRASKVSWWICQEVLSDVYCT